MAVSIPLELVWALVGYVLVSTGGFIWWAATVQEQLKTLTKLVDALTKDNTRYVYKEDIARELAVYEKRQDAMWEKYDKIKEFLDQRVK